MGPRVGKAEFRNLVSKFRFFASGYIYEKTGK
ncbi:hypothetical protein J2X71_003506 [Rhizobium sp. 1399]|nr:hypothetical protein [Rhizobium sp. 1399]